jgi:ubiquinone/menaquinone biosynthesis C-methylase UbiE
MSIKEPDQQVWDRFWEKKKDMSKVYPSSPSVLNTIKKNFDLKGLKVMEVGAGTGRDSSELARLGADVYVLDFSPESLAIVNAQKQQLELDNLTLVRGDAFQAPFPDNSFDLIFHQGLLEHFTNPLDLLKENFRLLKPGAHCLCDIPQTFHLYTVVKKILIAMDKWFAGWETQYTMPQLQRMMRQSGFDCIYKYGDWMRPNFIYRVIREVAMKVKINLPKYPLEGTAWQKWKDSFLDKLESNSLAHYTQLSIGVIGEKPKAG